MTKVSEFFENVQLPTMPDVARELIATMRQTLELLRGKPGMDDYLVSVRTTAAYLGEPWREQALELLDRFDPQGREGRYVAGGNGHGAGG